MSSLPAMRLRSVRPGSVHADGRFILYWMTANRRVRWNFALEHAVDWCRTLNRPLVVLETLEGGHRWSSARHHRFVLEGMRDNAERLREGPVLYYPYVAARSSQVKALLAALGRHACLIVCDDSAFDEQNLSSEELGDTRSVPVEAVDSMGLLPMRLAERAYPTAYAFRRFLQTQLPDHLLAPPRANPLARTKLPPAGPLPSAIVQRWRPANELLLESRPRLSGRWSIDRSVGPVATVGGSRTAEAALRRFVRDRLAVYAERRNHPDERVTSELASYLHFGHISAHQVFETVARHEDWSPDRLSEKADGRREGWWGMQEPAEAFLDQLVTWRELGHNFAACRSDYAEYDALPDWARTTLKRHSRDRREHVYDLGQFEQAATHDQLWNAAQRQLVLEGGMHNYLRMLWGKKIIEWSATPRDALDVMIELNNKYALDGCDPNSYAGIFWVLGRYDRPFGPERPIFGKVRYMSSENTARKLRLTAYRKRWGSNESRSG